MYKKEKKKLIRKKNKAFLKINKIIKYKKIYFLNFKN
jgi:hypothetical protein